MAKKRKTPSKLSRFRLRFTFWLDLNKPDENLIAEMVADLKANKLFVKTIRDGIRLICDLRAGRLNSLFELFPWVQEALTKSIPDVHISNGVGQLDEIKSILELIASQQATGGNAMQSTQLMIPTKISGISAPQPKLQVNKAAPADAETIADNFLSMFN